MTTFQFIIEVVEQQRPGYAASIGYGPVGTYAPSGLPRNLLSIFSRAIGTPHEVADQTLMDFLPGYRLMFAAEIPAVRRQLQAFYGEDELFDVLSRTPFLANYSSDYYLTDDSDNGVFCLDHQGGASLVSPNLETFLLTTLRCYEHGAYYLGADGLLEMDDDLECQVAVELNPGCEFWQD